MPERENVEKITVRAPSNIALVKYWGKRDKQLFLPYNSSLSVSLAELTTTTTLAVASLNKLTLNNQEFPPDSKQYRKIFDDYLPRAGELIGQDIPALQIMSRNNFPTAAGLASSASGYAALAIGLNGLLAGDLPHSRLSILARIGSGSATRSISGGFNAWLKGEQADGSDSVIEELKPASFWPEFRIKVCVTSTDQKSVNSTDAMANTVATSPLYKSLWLQTISQDLAGLRSALLAKDIKQLGAIAEHNALKMHDTMRTSNPPMDYWNNTTHLLTRAVAQLRESEKIPVFFTIDAGPQVKLIYLAEDEERVNLLARAYLPESDIINCTVSSGPELISEHLF